MECKHRGKHKSKPIERLDWGRILADAEWELAAARARVRRLTVTVRDVKRRIARGEQFPADPVHESATRRTTRRQM